MRERERWSGDGAATWEKKHHRQPAWYLPLSDTVNTRRAEPDAERDKVTTLDLDTPTTAWTKPSHSDTCERLEHDSILFTRTAHLQIKPVGRGGLS